MGVFEALKTFFSVLVKFFTVVLIMIMIAAISFEGVTYYITGNLYDFRKKVDVASEKKTDEKNETEQANQEDSYNSILFYTDTDRNYFDVRITLLNTKTGFIDVLLLPACSKVTVSGSLLNSLKEEVDVTGNEVTLDKIYRSYGDDKYEMMSKVLSEAFDIKFEVINVMNEKNMAEFLQLAGDVTVTLKNDMTYRNKKGILKVLKAGEQTLTAKQAISYMNYKNGTVNQEVNRLENVVEYFNLYFNQVLTQHTDKELYNQYTSLVTSTGERDNDKIMNAIRGLTSEGISIRVLQGSEENGEYTIDSQKAKLQISGLMTQAAAYSKNGENVSGLTDETIGDSKGYSVELFNAGYIAGLAGSWRDYLEGQGYTISYLDNYREGTLTNTEIVVTKEGLGRDFLKYFPNAEIKVEEISTGGDIRIYLGTDSAYMVPGYEDTKPEGVVLDGEEATESTDITESTEETDSVSEDADQTTEMETDDTETIGDEY